MPVTKQERYDAAEQRRYEKQMRVLDAWALFFAIVFGIGLVVAGVIPV